MFNIRFTKLKFKLRITKDGDLPYNKESAIRGGMGEMLLRQNCIHMRDCATCGFREDCVVRKVMYSRFKLKPDYVTTESIGYVVECDNHEEHFQAGDELCFYLILFGNTIVYFNQILQAFNALGRSGLGVHKCNFNIASIENRRGEIILQKNKIRRELFLVETIQDYVDERIQEYSDENRIVFITPVTLKYRGNFLRQFDSVALVESMVRRNYMLNCFEGNVVEPVNFGDDVPQIIGQTSEFHKVERYSSTEKCKMTLRGIKGEVVFDFIPEDLLPYVCAAELTHIGKNTSFGFGKFRIC